MEQNPHIQLILPVLSKYYGFDTEKLKIKQLEGFENKNFRVQNTLDSNYYLFKQYPLEKRHLDAVNSETNLLLHLQKQQNIKQYYPEPLKSNNKDYIITYKNEVDQKEYIFRLLTFLKGEPWNSAPRNIDLNYKLGEILGNMNVALKNYQDLVYQSSITPWNLCYINKNYELRQHIKDPSKLKVVDHFYLQYQQNVLPKDSSLRKQIIHNDVNDDNIIIQEGKITGIIDFGDTCLSYLVSDLAICCTYIALLDIDNFIDAIIPVIKGFHSVIPLENQEIEILYYLIAGRLVTSVSQSTYSYSQDPTNDYILKSQEFCWKMFQKMLRTNPIYLEYRIKDALGVSYEKKDQKYIDALLKQRHNDFSQSMSISYSTPVIVENGTFQFINDIFGNNILDSYNNIYHVGHSHPKVLQKQYDQMAKFNGNTRYLNEALTDYSSHLLSKFPSHLSKLFLVNSGSAASDLALRLALTYNSKRSKIVVMQYGYHGNTHKGIEVSSYKYSGKGGQGKAENIIELNLPDWFRIQNRIRDPQELSKELQNIIETAKQQILEYKDDIVCFISEPIIGCGGQIELPPGFFSEIFETVRSCGGINIMDETQTGFGRLGCENGQNYWCFQKYNLLPDAVIMGKPMGNGHPMAGVVTTDEIVKRFENGMEFFSSFGGNPVSCAAGKAVLEILEEENLVQNAYQVGTYWKQQIQTLKQKYRCIGDIRGDGLFLGVEIVKLDQDLTHDKETASKIKNEMRNKLVLISTDGPYDNVLKMKPPMCFNKQNVDEFIYKFDQILEKISVVPKL